MEQVGFLERFSMIGDDFHDCGQKFPEIDLDKWEAESRIRVWGYEAISEDRILALIDEVRKYQANSIKWDSICNQYQEQLQQRDEWIQKKDSLLMEIFDVAKDFKTSSDLDYIMSLSAKALAIGKDGK